MPLAQVRGVTINYKTIGESGPWVTLSPGGRNGYKNVESISRKIAAAGYRVLLHDRRNCGASDVSAEGPESEYEMWADDLHELLKQLNALPAYVGGASSGCRTSLLFAIRHPGTSRGLLLWRVTGGGRAARRLAQRYYGDPIAAANKGGMAAVCEMEHFKEMIAARPENRQRLMSMDAQCFIAAMQHWNDCFLRGADQPVIGATEDQIRSIKIPVCILPGNDLSHTPECADTLNQLLPHSELHKLVTQFHELDVGPRDEWAAKEDQHVQIYLDFMKRVEAGTAR